MRMSRLVGLGATITAILVTVTTPVADAATAAPEPVGSTAPAYYLSLGDSLGFGYSDAKLAAFGTNGQLSDFVGYTDDLAAYLGVAATNLSCPGETSSTMINGGCPWTLAGAPLHSSYRGAQLAAATTFLVQHRLQRGFITVSIGSNDVLPVAQECLTDPTCSALTPVLTTMRGNLSTTLNFLRRAAPLATIAVLAPYNPFGFAYPQSNIAAGEFDLSIAGVTVLHLDRVADAFVPINLRYQPSGCSPLLYFCLGTSSDVHPTDAGYAVIAQSFEKVLR